MNPLFIGGAIVAAFALLKKKSDTPSGGNSSPPLKSDSKLGSDTSYLISDVIKVGAGAAGALGSGGLTIFTGAAGAAVATLGLALVPLIAAAAFIALAVIGARMAEAKSMAQQWLNLLPNARLMSFYEDARFEELCKINKTEVQVVGRLLDPRLNQTFKADGQQYNFIGERAAYAKVSSPTNAVDFLRIQKAMRTVALYFTLECGKYANAMLRNWGPKIGSGGHTALAPKEFWLNELYNDLPGYEGEKLGGLNQIPLPAGYTEVRRTSLSNPNPPAPELRGVNTSPLPDSDVAAWLAEARFMAFARVLETIKYDNALYFPWEPIRYAKDVYNRMELSAPNFLLNGSILTLPHAQWGYRDANGSAVNLNVDIIKVKDGAMNPWFQTRA